MGCVFDIKRYAVNDGPGIRITIFLKGCPLSCVWCHNPEGISVRKEKLYTLRKCIGCRTCVEACPGGALRLTAEGIVTDRSLCTLCGHCADVCPALAMEMSGREWTAEALMREIEKERLFMDQSGGGVTFCGGEPLMQPAFLKEMLLRCGEAGIHRAVDTTLYARQEVIDEIAAETDLFLVDLKLMDSARHRLFCGVPNELIVSNLRRIAAGGNDFIIRIPLIEGVNAGEENIRASAAFLASLSWRRKVVHLLPYHDIGRGKHEKMGTVYNAPSYPMAPPSEEAQLRCKAWFEEVGIEAIIGG